MSLDMELTVTSGGRRICFVMALVLVEDIEKIMTGTNLRRREGNASRV